MMLLITINTTVSGNNSKNLYNIVNLQNILTYIACAFVLRSRLINDKLFQVTHPFYRASACSLSRVEMTLICLTVVVDRDYTRYLLTKSDSLFICHKIWGCRAILK